MKYIRTKDGIEKVPNDYANKLVECPNLVIADTIQELCDEFAQFLPNGTRPFIIRNKMSQVALNDFLLMNKLNQWELYGAIWTIGEHGEPILKSVAKMNDKGELELL